MVQDFAPHVLQDHVHTLQQWRDVDGICRTQVMLLHGPNQVNLLGWALREFSRLDYDSILLLPHHINCCGDDNKLNIIHTIFSEAEKNDSVLILMPNAETSFFTDRTVHQVISPMVADLGQRMESCRERNRKLHLVLISHSPWLLDGKLLESGRIDKSLLVLPAVWRETSEDQGILNQLTQKVLTKMTDQIVTWLGSDPGGAAVDYLTELVNSDVTFSLQHEAMSQAILLLPEKDRKYLAPLLTELEKKSQKILQIEKLNAVIAKANVDIERLLSLLRFTPNDGVFPWIQTFLTALVSPEGINGIGQRRDLENVTLQCFIDLDSHSIKGMNFESMFTYWLQRAQLSQPEAIVDRILESYGWDWILNFFPYGKVEFSREYAWQMFKYPDVYAARNVVWYHFLGKVRFDQEEGEESEIAFFTKLVTRNAEPSEQKMAAWLIFEKGSYTPPQLLVRLLKTKVSIDEISNVLTRLSDYQPMEPAQDKAKIDKMIRRLLRMIEMNSPLQESIKAFSLATTAGEQSRIYKALRSRFFECYEKGEFR